MNVAELAPGDDEAGAVLLREADPVPQDHVEVERSFKEEMHSARQGLRAEGFWDFGD